MSTAPTVILIAGPAGSGKTSTAARISEQPGWAHVSEDEFWVRIKTGRPPGELRTRDEQDVVHEQVMERVLELISAGKRVALEFILYEDPPRPLLLYQEALAAAGIHVTTRLLRPDVDEILRRMAHRGRPRDRDLRELRANCEHQWRVLDSSHIDPSTVIDSTKLSQEDVFERYFKPLLEG